MWTHWPLGAAVTHFVMPKPAKSRRRYSTSPFSQGDILVGTIDGHYGHKVHKFVKVTRVDTLSGTAYASLLSKKYDDYARDTTEEEVAAYEDDFMEEHPAQTRTTTEGITPGTAKEAVVVFAAKSPVGALKGSNSHSGREAWKIHFKRWNRAPVTDVVVKVHHD